ncbi:DNA-formamidopyrimidine glycosylase family protein [Actinoplanes sp. URMC 104]|uniref:DNA-formamidopyrimidine glycosylase family protein n=1 Tax=Actinoplanes sp. URMC 104 TaxID=3423409 RepID=UPI003F1B4D9E
MAEGDSIRRLAARLTSSLAGRDVLAGQFRRGGEIPPSFAGDRLVTVAAVGKHLLMRFGSERTVHSHLRMQGSWRIHRAGWRPGPAADRVGAWFDFGPAGVLAAHAMPVLRVLPTAREHEAVGHLGPDILTDRWPAAAPAVATDPARRIREALLDQRNVCGIGNLWAVEGLFIAGVWPHTPAGRVDVARVLDVIARMMRLGLRNGSQSTTGDLRRGRTHWVYGRYRRPCLRCGTPVAFVAAGSDPYDRETWWCPHCQPQP